MSMFTKLNIVEKLPEVFRKQELWEIMSINLFKIKGYVECAIVMQYIEKNSITNFLLIIEKINCIPGIYIHFFLDVFFIEKIVEKLYIIGDQNETIDKLVFFLFLNFFFLFFYLI